jgi:SulP family sulfate permease
LATYALSDNASQRSTSPTPHRSRQTQTRLENYFQGGDSETASSRTGEGLQNHTIHEVSEPVSPEVGPVLGKSPGTSIIADMLRRSPPSTSPEDVDQTPINRRSQDGDDESNVDRRQSSQTTDRAQLSEITPLLGKDVVDGSRHRDWIRGEDDIEGQKDAQQVSRYSLRQAIAYPVSKARDALSIVINPKAWSGKAILQNVVLAPVATLPAVILGLLMNVLDALSYGMILFPLGQPIFENLGPAGISMFYVSTIISQLVYSCGGSIFKGGIGSEMIEVVPFFHAMAFSIMQEVGEENPAAVIATTITTYALSSVITGLVFFLMGYFNFGYIVGFIPRHILIGCIGGVGFFLMVTGIEVTARLEGNLNYNLATLQKLFQLDTLPLWLIPLTLAIFLFAAQHKISSKYFLPGFIVTIPLVFYFFVFSIDQLEPSGLRQSGWIFDGPEAGEPWWYFYTLYGM